MCSCCFKSSIRQTDLKRITAYTSVNIYIKFEKGSEAIRSYTTVVKTVQTYIVYGYIVFEG